MTRLTEKLTVRAALGWAAHESTRAEKRRWCLPSGSHFISALVCILSSPAQAYRKHLLTWRLPGNDDLLAYRSMAAARKVIEGGGPEAVVELANICRANEAAGSSTSGSALEVTVFALATGLLQMTCMLEPHAEPLECLLDIRPRLLSLQRKSALSFARYAMCIQGWCNEGLGREAEAEAAPCYGAGSFLLPTSSILQQHSLAWAVPAPCRRGAALLRQPLDRPGRQRAARAQRAEARRLQRRRGSGAHLRALPSHRLQRVPGGCGSSASSACKLLNCLPGEAAPSL